MKPKIKGVKERPDCKICGKPAKKRNATHYKTKCQSCIKKAWKLKSEKKEAQRKKQSLNDMSKNTADRFTGYRTPSVRSYLRNT